MIVRWLWKFPIVFLALNFRKRWTVSSLLEQQNPPKQSPADTVLESLSTVYRQHGWKGKKPAPRTEANMPSQSTEACVQLPEIRFRKLYHLLAIEGNDLERALREVDPQFSIMGLMLKFCEKYDVSIGETFPSLRSNRPQPQARPLSRQGDEKEEPLSVLCSDDSDQLWWEFDEEDQSCDDEEEDQARPLDRQGDKMEEPFLSSDVEESSDDGPWVEVDSDDQSRDDEEEDQEDIRLHHEEVTRDHLASEARIEERKVAPERTHFGRLIPVSFLPLFLHMMPLSFQKVNYWLNECEMLQLRLLQFYFDEQEYPHVRDQIRFLGKNRRHMGFVYQQAHFNQRCGSLAE
jgi:hypothetical protein